MGELDLEGRRLLWRCRRGMKELDVLLERFARTRFPVAGGEERQVLARFLELPDPQLAAYLLGDTVPAEPEFRKLASSIVGAPAC
jgi:antitoxin CptB